MVVLKEEAVEVIATTSLEKRHIKVAEEEAEEAEALLVEEPQMLVIKEREAAITPLLNLTKVTNQEMKRLSRVRLNNNLNNFLATRKKSKHKMT